MNPSNSNSNTTTTTTKPSWMLRKKPVVVEEEEEEIVQPKQQMYQPSDVNGEVDSIAYEVLKGEDETAKMKKLIPANGTAPNKNGYSKTKGKGGNPMYNVSRVCQQFNKFALANIHNGLFNRRTFAQAEETWHYHVRTKLGPTSNRMLLNTMNSSFKISNHHTLKSSGWTDLTKSPLGLLPEFSLMPIRVARFFLDGKVSKYKLLNWNLVDILCYIIHKDNFEYTGHARALLGVNGLEDIAKHLPLPKAVLDNISNNNDPQLHKWAHGGVKKVNEAIKQCPPGASIPPVIPSKPEGKGFAHSTDFPFHAKYSKLPMIWTIALRLIQLTLNYYSDREYAAYVKEKTTPPPELEKAKQLLQEWEVYVAHDSVTLALTLKSFYILSSSHCVHDQTSPDTSVVKEWFAKHNWSAGAMAGMFGIIREMGLQDRQNSGIATADESASFKVTRKEANPWNKIVNNILKTPYPKDRLAYMNEKYTEAQQRTRVLGMPPTLGWTTQFVPDRYLAPAYNSELVTSASDKDKKANFPHLTGADTPFAYAVWALIYHCGMWGSVGEVYSSINIIRPECLLFSQFLPTMFDYIFRCGTEQEMVVLEDPSYKDYQSGNVPWIPSHELIDRVGNATGVFPSLLANNGQQLVWNLESMQNTHYNYYDSRILSAFTGLPIEAPIRKPARLGVDVADFWSYYVQLRFLVDNHLQLKATGPHAKVARPVFVYSSEKSLYDGLPETVRLIFSGEIPPNFASNFKVDPSSKMVTLERPNGAIDIEEAFPVSEARSSTAAIMTSEEMKYDEKTNPPVPTTEEQMEEEKNNTELEGDLTQKLPMNWDINAIPSEGDDPEVIAYALKRDNRLTPSTLREWTDDWFNPPKLTPEELAKETDGNWDLKRIKVPRRRPYTVYFRGKGQDLYTLLRDNLPWNPERSHNLPYPNTPSEVKDYLRKIYGTLYLQANYMEDAKRVSAISGQPGYISDAGDLVGFFVTEDSNGQKTNNNKVYTQVHGATYKDPLLKLGSPPEIFVGAEDIGFSASSSMAFYVLAKEAAESRVDIAKCKDFLLVTGPDAAEFVTSIPVVNKLCNELHDIELSKATMPTLVRAQALNAIERDSSQILWMLKSIISKDYQLGTLAIEKFNRGPDQKIFPSYTTNLSAIVTDNIIAGEGVHPDKALRREKYLDAAFIKGLAAQTLPTDDCYTLIARLGDQITKTKMMNTALTELAAEMKAQYDGINELMESMGVEDEALNLLTVKRTAKELNSLLEDGLKWRKAVEQNERATPLMGFQRATAEQRLSDKEYFAGQR